MQVSVEELGGLERRITVQVPAEKIDKEIQNRLLSLSRRVKVDGFRPGKVPFKMVKRLYGSQVRQEVLGDVLQSSFQDALHQENLRLVGGPTIEPKSMDEGVDMEYSATFEVFPEFELNGTEGLKVERPTAEITEADIDAMLETLRKQRTLWNDVDRASQQGERVTVDFEGKVDGQDCPGNQGENMPVVLGAGTRLKEFEDKLVGLRVGDEAEFDVTFPGNYHVQELAGKQTHFLVKVKAVAEPSLPEVNDEFAAGFGIKEGGVEGLRKALRENMERELREGIKTIVKRQLMQGLWDANDIPLPQVMINREIDQLAKQMGFPESAKAKEHKQAAAFKAQLFGPEARRRVALGLLISRLVATQQIKLDEAHVRERLASIASTYEEAAEVVQWYGSNPQALEGIRAMALEDQVVDWLLERAAVSDKPSSFDKIMRPAAAAATSAQE